ncbi:MAG: DUF1580 domain-containing protein [Pirellulales bacterium]
MIDIATEHLLTLAEAAQLLPGRPSVSTLWRWRQKGVRGRRLETVLIGAKPYTSREALGRFAEQEGGDSDSVTSSCQPRSPGGRELAISRAERELAEEGV